MRNGWMVLASAALVCGCQSVAGRNGAVRDENALVRLATTLPGEYDNHEQVQQAATTARAGTGIAVPHVRETLQALGDDWWLWRLQVIGAATETQAVWIYRMAVSASGLSLTPYRPLDPAVSKTLAGADRAKFKFDAAQWAELAPCAERGEWKSGQFHAAADATACSALLPGLGESAGLLPLAVILDGEMLHTTTFADQARGSGARIDARRVHWFTGWSALNGGGPSATAGNQDWHTQHDLRLSSEGGRVPLRWRDGAASGWSLELTRTTYAERQLSVLQLNLVEDASGRVLAYAWTNAQSDALGINLGWVQVGLNMEQPKR